MVYHRYQLLRFIVNNTENICTNSKIPNVSPKLIGLGHRLEWLLYSKLDYLYRHFGRNPLFIWKWQYHVPVTLFTPWWCCKQTLFSVTLSKYVPLLGSLLVWLDMFIMANGGGHPCGWFHCHISVGVRGCPGGFFCLFSLISCFLWIKWLLSQIIHWI